MTNLRLPSVASSSPQTGRRGSDVGQELSGHNIDADHVPEVVGESHSDPDRFADTSLIWHDGERSVEAVLWLSENMERADRFGLRTCARVSKTQTAAHARPAALEAANKSAPSQRSSPAGKPDACDPAAASTPGNAKRADDTPGGKNLVRFCIAGALTLAGVAAACSLAAVFGAVAFAVPFIACAAVVSAPILMLFVGALMVLWERRGQEA
jgi:hypothetical protein